MRHVRTILAASLFAALSVFTPGTASAGECTYGVCGSIKNVSNGLYLRVTGDWGDKQPNALVGPGAYGPYRDDDGFYVPAYYDAYVVNGSIGYWATATGWHKVGDNYNTYYVSLRKS